jgi:hypothetical protein
MHIFSLFDYLQECTPFGDWSGSFKKAVYYVHFCKRMPVIYPDIFIGQVISYHRSACSKIANTLNHRVHSHKVVKTIDTKQEEMIGVLAGSKKSVKLIKALVQVLCKCFLHY